MGRNFHLLCLSFSILLLGSVSYGAACTVKTYVTNYDVVRERAPVSAAEVRRVDNLQTITIELPVWPYRANVAVWSSALNFHIPNGGRFSWRGNGRYLLVHIPQSCGTSFGTQVQSAENIGHYWRRTSRGNYLVKLYELYRSPVHFERMNFPGNRP